MRGLPSGVRVAVSEDKETATLQIDDAVYSDPVVTKAAYWFTDRCYIDIHRSEMGGLVAVIRGKDGGCDLMAVAGEFCNALVDFALRARVAAETADIQEALLRRAFLELIPGRG